MVSKIFYITYLKIFYIMTIIYHKFIILSTKIAINMILFFITVKILIKTMIFNNKFLVLTNLFYGYNGFRRK